jgi:hypothetical protein
VCPLVPILRSRVNSLPSAEIFHTPFEVYTDPTLQLYTALGMTRRTLDAGPEEERGEYIRHGLMSGVAMVVMNALKAGMPVWEKGGDISQLGGEFILGPGYDIYSWRDIGHSLTIECRLECSYAHRMKTTRGHEPILRVLAVAGVEPLRLPMETEPMSPLMSAEEERRRIEERQKHLERLRERKGRRRRLGVSGEAQAVIDWEKVQISTPEERDDAHLLAGGVAAVPRRRRNEGDDKQGYWRRGLERWDVIVDQYSHAQEV